MAIEPTSNIDIFAPQKDFLDTAVESYEQNVPLAAQIAAGFTPPGIAIDLAEATKYGRDAYRQASAGQFGPAAGSAGIAALSALGVIPIVGDLLKTGGKSAIKSAFLNKDILAKQDKKDLERIINDPKLSDSLKTQQIINHPAIIRAEKQMNEIPKTSTAPDYGTANYMNNRQFNFSDKSVVGYEDGIDELYKGGKTLAYREMGLKIPENLIKKNTGEKIAIINIGPPAAGKSAIANPLAVKYNATIVDPDEAKKVLPEFGGGIGGNAVHQESKVLANGIHRNRPRSSFCKNELKIFTQRQTYRLRSCSSLPRQIRNFISTIKKGGYSRWLWKN